MRELQFKSSCDLHTHLPLIPVSQAANLVPNFANGHRWSSRHTILPAVADHVILIPKSSSVRTSRRSLDQSTQKHQIGNGFVLVHTKKHIEKGQAKKDRNWYFVLDQTPEYDEPKLLCYTELSLFLFRLHEFKGCPTRHHEGDICSVKRKFSAPTLSQHWSRSLMGSHTSKVCCWRNRGSSTT